MKKLVWVSIVSVAIILGLHGISEAKGAKKKVDKKSENSAVIETKFGKIVFKFLPEVAPKTVENFKKLAREKFYDDTTFHRVIKGFMIQGGDPNSKSADRSTHGRGGPGYNIKAEFSNEKHTRGAVSMARSSDPDSAGSQFFIVVADSTYLDHQYTVFGRVTEGMDVADKIVSQKTDPSDNPVEKVTMKVTLR